MANFTWQNNQSLVSYQIDDQSFLLEYKSGNIRISLLRGFGGLQSPIHVVRFLIYFNFKTPGPSLRQLPLSQNCLLSTLEQYKQIIHLYAEVKDATVPLSPHPDRVFTSCCQLVTANCHGLLTTEARRMAVIMAKSYY